MIPFCLSYFSMTTYLSSPLTQKYTGCILVGLYFFMRIFYLI
jgi:hypothetical protein